MNAKVRVCEPIQSDNPCVQVASAYVRLDAPSTATQLRRHHFAGQSVNHSESRAA